MTATVQFRARVERVVGVHTQFCQTVNTRWTPTRRPSRLHVLTRATAGKPVVEDSQAEEQKSSEPTNAEGTDEDKLDVYDIEEVLKEEDAVEEDTAADEASSHRSETGARAGTRAVSTSLSPPEPAPTSRGFGLPRQPILHYGTVALGGFVAINAALILFRVVRKLSSPQHRRQRTVNKNQLVVTTLGQYLPLNRAGLTNGVLKSLRFRTGFNNIDIFRKYLWFALCERAFDQDTIDDLIALKEALQLTGAEVASALRERAERVYDKYGNVMLDTSGMTAAGIERKTASRSLFSKLQYLSQCEDLLSTEDAREVDLRRIFGATEDDAARLRIVSLQQVDLDKLMQQEAAPATTDEETKQETGPSEHLEEN